VARLIGSSNLQFEAGSPSLQKVIQSRDRYFNLQLRRHGQQHKLVQAQLWQLALEGVLLESGWQEGSAIFLQLATFTLRSVQRNQRIKQT
jgi:hypothetical protein